MFGSVTAVTMEKDEETMFPPPKKDHSVLARLHNVLHTISTAIIVEIIKSPFWPEQVWYDDCQRLIIQQMLHL